LRGLPTSNLSDIVGSKPEEQGQSLSPLIH
jgi:hypothetical protein